MPTPKLSSLDHLYKVGVADGFVGATAAQLAQGIALEDALPLSCALGSMSLLVPMPGADVLCDDGIAAEPVGPWPGPALDHELHSLRLQATGAVSSYVSGVFAADAKEDADQAVVNGDEEDADEEAAKDKVARLESALTAHFLEALRPPKPDRFSSSNGSLLGGTCTAGV